MMIELRWLERETGVKLMNEWGYYYPETERVLQFRARTEVIDYSYGSNYRVTHWSDWTDVPVVLDNNSDTQYSTLPTHREVK